MLKRIVTMLVVLGMAAAAVNIGDTAERLHSLEENVLRLHILANSDSTDDQLEKLRIRDAILEQAANWYGNAASQSEAKQAVENALPEIVATAEQTLAETGSNHIVTACVCRMVFPERQYGDLTLPAGEYDTLQIEIGSAEGQNWWCVMYPDLCIPAAAKSDSVETEVVFDTAAQDLVEHPESYRVSLKCVELGRAVKTWAADQFNAWIDRFCTDIP